MDIEIDVDVRRAVWLLHGVADRVSDLSPAFGDIAEDFARIEAGMFATGGHGRWGWPSAAWTRRKAAQGKSVLPLVFTGTLAKSLTRRGSKFAVRRVTPTELVVATRDPVVNLLAGKSKRRRKLAKPGDVVNVTERDTNRWAGLIGDHVAGGGRRRGFVGFGE